MYLSTQLRNKGCQVLLYLRAPSNLYCFYLDPSGVNFSGTPVIAFVEGLFLFSLIYSPLILVTRYVIDIGWFTYPAFVLLSAAIYGIGFIDKFESIANWQYDRCSWFPGYFLHNGYTKLALGFFFFVIQIAVSGVLMVAYIQK